MRVNKYKINVKDLTDSGSTINLPIKMSFIPIDQSEIVERDFVEKEIEDSINVINDYEKVRFIPVDSLNNQLKSITYSVNLLSGTTFPTTTMYSHAGFDYDDVKFSKNSFKRSFLRLSFYDSDIPTNQNLISFMTLYTRLTVNDIKPLTSGGLPVIGGGLPNSINQIPIRYRVEDPISNPDGIAEGYNIYHFKDEVTSTIPKELFMRASWNNAKTGKSTALITDSTPQRINNLVSKLHVRYVLKRDNIGWWYEIDMNYSSPNNITLTSGEQTLQLYQIQAI